MHTLKYVGTRVCGRMRNSSSTLICAEYFRDKFKHVTNTLQYVGIRCPAAKRSQNFVFA